MTRLLDFLWGYRRATSIEITHPLGHSDAFYELDDRSTFTLHIVSVNLPIFTPNCFPNCHAILLDICPTSCALAKVGCRCIKTGTIFRS